jgi:sugar phosphate isomerase/epimerase
MLFGGHVKSVADIDYLRHLRFDFGEVVLANQAKRQYWRESGVKNEFGPGFFLVAHGPAEGPPNDVQNLWNNYYPALVETIDLAHAMSIRFMTIHCWMDGRFVHALTRSEKKEALRQIVRYAEEKQVVLGLENLSENTHDFIQVFEEVPGLTMTLDVGHGQLLTETNTAFGFIRELMPHIKHLHVHDNRGGGGVKDDLHLSIGRGTIDFYGIMRALVENRYEGTVTLELEHEDLLPSMETLKRILDAVSR